MLLLSSSIDLQCISTLKIEGNTITDAAIYNEKPNMLQFQIGIDMEIFQHGNVDTSIRKQIKINTETIHTPCRNTSCVDLSF